MFDSIKELYGVDWRIFIAAAEAWIEGRSPYGALSAEFSAGAFAYPPTALTWMSLFLPLGAFSFYVWTCLELFGWWLLIRNRCRSQLVLLLWSPMLLNLVEGQNTLAMVLILWGAFQAERRGWLWGLLLAFALTKPQVALVPLAWLLWQDRHSPDRWRLWGGIVIGTVLLALPPTMRDPHIWQAWITSLGSYRARVLQMAAWQGPGIVLFVLALYLWFRGGRGGWHWWIAAAAFPHTSYYGMVALLPMLRPRQNNWTLAGLAIAGVLQGPMTPITLPLILAGHLLAGWMLAGGPTVPVKQATSRRAPALSAPDPL